MLKIWPFTTFIALFAIAYGLSALVSETPFFVASDSYKFQQIEWLYKTLGPVFSGTLLLSIGGLLSYFAIIEYKENQSDEAGLTALLLLKFFLALIVIIFIVLGAFW